MGKPDDLVLSEWPDLDWSGGHAGESLQRAHAVVRGRGKAAMTWYLDHRTSKSWRSKAIRGTVALLVAVGAACPALALADPDLAISDYGYVALTLAAGIFGLDKVFGFSSSWMRYVATAMTIKARLERDDLEWEKLLAEVKGRPPTRAEVERCLDHLLGLTEELQAMVTNETRQWSGEIAAALVELQAAAAAAGHGTSV